MGPGAAAFALEPAFGRVPQEQRKREKQAMKQLEKDYRKDSAASEALGGSDPAWLKDRKVRRLKDLESEGYSPRSRSSTDVSEVDDKDTIVIGGDEML